MKPDPIAESLRPDSGLTPMARRVAQFIHANRPLALASSAAELAERIGTSDATVIRSVQAMGFDSLAALRAALIASLTHARDPASALSRTIEDIGSDLDDAVGGILQTHADMAAALQHPATRRHIADAVRALHPCPRIVVFGIGPSRGLADYICRVLNRNGLTSLPIGTTGRAFADDLVALRPGDGVIIMAYGTLYREIALLFRETRRMVLPAVLVTDRIAAADVPPGTVIVSAMRGKEEHIALHSATVAVLEAIAFGLSVARRDHTMATLDRLNDFRNQIEQF
ncbi:MurR/RpiR family transcriptional regulator [Gluconacetobacter tumulicola]|uniref:MurR/RpiR family transcriptional regulator n=1 Tax=Gluconacetobacter tumulicola TaxID=1017177 RepID=A0A7W4JFQ7_9PROT|nr:MurR/RpiR family transcriptional regulator [Gluconacetobacter tumulicola]MBB2180244.1 MurR/RpiR family transcriptional regulator [Gluconacetobacter tumulicola]